MLRSLIRRGVISLVDQLTLKIQAKLGLSESENDIPLVFQHGFVSIPVLGANAVVVRTERGSLCFGSTRPSFIPEGLAIGDVAVYDSRGQSIVLSATGVKITSPSITLGEGATEALLKASFTDALVSQLILVKDSTGTPLNVAGAFAEGWDTTLKTTLTKGA